jgi:hypothetical protein
VRAVAAHTVASDWRGRGSRHGGQQRRACAPRSAGWAAAAAAAAAEGNWEGFAVLPFCLFINRENNWILWRACRSDGDKFRLRVEDLEYSCYLRSTLYPKV